MRVLGIDYGERRIGLALSDRSRTLARPLRTLRAAGSLAERAAAVVAEAQTVAAEADGLSVLVVGVPRSLDGLPHEQTTRVLSFVDLLRGSVDVPVALQDERLTSVEAEARLAVRERSWRKRKSRLDAAAAAIILQDYLDERLPPLPAPAEAEAPAGSDAVEAGGRRAPHPRDALAGARARTR